MKKFDNVMIVTDLDGTFLGKDAVLVERNLRAVEYFKQNGGSFAVATGRVPSHVKEAVPMIGELVNMPCITNNGGCIYDFEADKVVKLYPTPFDAIRDAVNMIHRDFPRACVRGASLEYGFITTEQDLPNKYMVYDFTKNATITKLVAPIDEWKKYPLFKMAVRCAPELIEKIIGALLDGFGDVLSPVQSGSTTIDVLSRGLNKGVLLRELVSAPEYKGKKIYACGDHTNDIEMLCEADVAVCPSGAHERAKAVSDLCLCSNDEGVVADLIEYIENTKLK